MCFSLVVDPYDTHSDVLVDHLPLTLRVRFMEQMQFMQGAKYLPFKTKAVFSKVRAAVSRKTHI